MSETATIPLSPEVLAELDKLKDIRLPEPISWWPPAYGWWVLATALLVVILVLLTYVAIRRSTVRHAALRELEQLKSAYNGLQANREQGTRIGVLLRRIALARSDAQSLASAHSENWEAFLAAEPDGMARPLAHFIANAPYAPDNDNNAHDTNLFPTSVSLFEAAEKWIRRHA